MTYYPGGSRVLKKINLSTKGGAKIGIAGRTSAGKSSFIAALMRMPSADRDITINDIPVKEVNIQETRQCISVLDQNPVLLGEKKGFFEKKSGWPKSFSRCGPMASVRGRAAERFGRKSRGTA